MRKNRMMRLASALLIVTMLTTCAISGTFAKYVTSDSGTDSARVAKWGVEITANGTTFADTYATDDEGVVSTIANSVVGTDKLVAPGTKDDMMAMDLSGQPEVAVHVSYAAELILTNWEISEEEYCPIVFTVGEAKYKIDATNNTVAELEKAVEDAIAAYSADYSANDDLSNANTPAVSWEWPFHSSADNDVKDTALGDAATAATISLTVTTTVTQID